MKQLSVATAEGILVLVFDSIVLLLTVAKTWQLHQQWKALSNSWRTSLSAVILHDGLFD